MYLWSSIWKVLEYLVSDRGIEANPANINSIQDTPVPRIVKEIQRLARRTTSLGSFLARAGEIGLLFNQIQRCPTKFEWTTNGNNVFQKPKAYLFSLPILVTHVTNETLSLYLAISPKIISSVFYSKHDNNMELVYYVSHVLNSPKERYDIVLWKNTFCVSLSLLGK